MNALSFECRKVALKQDRTGYVLTLCMHPDEIPVELLRDFVGSRYMVAMAKLGDDETPEPYNNRVQKAGMLCKTREFQYWLTKVNQAERASENDAINAIYKICHITSRTELNGNADAQKLFDELVNAYERWNKEEPF
jgi:hypothetical protein